MKNFANYSSPWVFMGSFVLLAIALAMFLDVRDQMRATTNKPTGAAAETIRLMEDPTPNLDFGPVVQGKASFYDYNLCKLPSGVIVGRAPQCFAGETLVSANYGSQHPTCAARHVPRGTFLLVKNVSNGLEVLCKVNDYGPDASVHPDRTVDLSVYSFQQIANLSAGVIKVEIKTVKYVGE